MRHYLLLLLVASVANALHLSEGPLNTAPLVYVSVYPAGDFFCSQPPDTIRVFATGACQKDAVRYYCPDTFDALNVTAHVYAEGDTTCTGPVDAVHSAPADCSFMGNNRWYTLSCEPPSQIYPNAPNFNVHVSLFYESASDCDATEKDAFIGAIVQGPQCNPDRDSGLFSVRLCDSEGAQSWMAMDSCGDGCGLCNQTFVEDLPAGGMCGLAGPLSGPTTREFCAPFDLLDLSEFANPIQLTGCVGTPCLNGGECTQGANGPIPDAWTCNCTVPFNGVQYTGPRCETAVRVVEHYVYLVATNDTACDRPSSYESVYGGLCIDSTKMTYLPLNPNHDAILVERWSNSDCIGPPDSSNIVSGGVQNCAPINGSGTGYAYMSAFPPILWNTTEVAQISYSPTVELCAVGVTGKVETYATQGCHYDRGGEQWGTWGCQDNALVRGICSSSACDNCMFAGSVPESSCASFPESPPVSLFCHESQEVAFSTPSPDDVCLFNPCENGDCVELGDGEFRCDCFNEGTEWGGELCDEVVSVPRPLGYRYTSEDSNCSSTSVTYAIDTGRCLDFADGTSGFGECLDPEDPDQFRYREYSGPGCNSSELVLDIWSELGPNDCVVDGNGSSWFSCRGPAREDLADVLVLASSYETPNGCQDEPTVRALFPSGACVRSPFVDGNDTWEMFDCSSGIRSYGCNDDCTNCIEYEYIVVPKSCEDSFQYGPFPIEYECLPVGNFSAPAFSPCDGDPCDVGGECTAPFGEPANCTYPPCVNQPGFGPVWMGGGYQCARCDSVSFSVNGLECVRCPPLQEATASGTGCQTAPPSAGDVLRSDTVGFDPVSGVFGFTPVTEEPGDVVIEVISSNPSLIGGQSPILHTPGTGLFALPRGMDATGVANLEVRLTDNVGRLRVIFIVIEFTPTAFMLETEDGETGELGLRVVARQF